ncbi:hypothetical protein [Nocardioides aequoreus]|uniref:hypothetical protein n=1 Tax=Nocardioides aequoreus TaxID=397278 RepID=UPI0004C399C9|nr:hypothetical protein [Nocardioides aequoreus]
MTTKQNTFEGLTSGAAITPANSGGASGDAFDTVTGTVVAQSSAALASGRGLSAAIASAMLSAVAWTVSGATQYVRIYFKTDTGSTTHNKRMVINGTPGSTSLGWDLRQIVSTERVGIATRNTTRFELGPTGVASGTLARDTWYRLEARIVAGSSGTIEARLYDLAGTLLSQSSWTGQVDAVTSMQYGVANGTNTTSAIALDNLGWSDTDWLGPYVAPDPPAAAGTLAQAMLVDFRSSTPSGRTFSITQDSGSTGTPVPIEAGLWAIPRATTGNRVYTVTVTHPSNGLTDTEQITVPAAEAAPDTIEILTRDGTGWA